MAILDDEQAGQCGEWIYLNAPSDTEKWYYLAQAGALSAIYKVGVVTGIVAISMVGLNFVATGILGLDGLRGMAYLFNLLALLIPTAALAAYVYARRAYEKATGEPMPRRPLK